MGIVLSDTAPGVNHEHHNVRIGDRLEGLHDRKLLDRLENTALLAETGRIHERERMTVVLEVDIDRVAGRAGHIERDDALFTEQRVHERRLADIRASGDRDTDPVFALFLLGGLLFLLILREGGKHGFHQARDTLTVSG